MTSALACSRWNGLVRTDMGRRTRLPEHAAAPKPRQREPARARTCSIAGLSWEATVAAYVGLGGLGRYLIDGIQTGDYVSTAGGAIVVSVLALIVDGVLALIQRLVVSPGLTGRNVRNQSRRRGMSATDAEVAPESEAVSDTSTQRISS